MGLGWVRADFVDLLLNSNRKSKEIGFDWFKALTVLLLCLKTCENLRFWEIEEPKPLTVLILCFKKYENLRFYTIE